MSEPSAPTVKKDYISGAGGVFRKENEMSKVADALKNNGCDLTTASSSGDMRPVPAAAVRGAIIDLAKEAIEQAALSLASKAAQHQRVAGLTIEALDTLKDFEAEIFKQERLSRSVLESVRSLKSAMAVEMQCLDKAVKQLKDLNIEKTIADLDRLKSLAESATIKKLFSV